MYKSEKYYNDKESNTLTYLEFGSINMQSSQKNVWDLRLHQEAYDFFMCSRYMKDLLEYRIFKEKMTTESFATIIKRYQQTVYTQDIYNSFSKLASLSICHDNLGIIPSFLEIGSTLMGCIDSLEFLNLALSQYAGLNSGVNVKEIPFVGIEISEFLNGVVKIVYPNYNCHLIETIDSFKRQVGVFFAKGVSLLYAIKSCEEMANLLSQAEIATFDYSFSFKGSDSDYLGTGKKVVYLNANELLAQLRTCNSKKNLFIETKTAQFDAQKNRIRALFYYGSEVDVKKIILKEKEFKSALCKQLDNQKDIASLYYRQIENLEINSWCLFDEFLSSLN